MSAPDLGSKGFLNQSCLSLYREMLGFLLQLSSVREKEAGYFYNTFS
jgi:hypothetical protein